MCYESNYFHVMVQGIERKNIYKNKYFKEKYINFMKVASENNGVDIIAYCIMDNHAHYLLYCEDSHNVSKVMSSANTKFGKIYNKVNKRCGYVFRDRYRCENIYTEEYLKHCVRYIIQNPVKAGICSDARLYQYSKYNLDSTYKCENEEYFYDSKISEDSKFIDIDNEFGDIKEFELPNQVLERYGYVVGEYENLPKIVNELEKICGMNKTEISKVLGINRTKLYREMNK